MTYWDLKTDHNHNHNNLQIGSVNEFKIAKVDNKNLDTYIWVLCG